MGKKEPGGWDHPKERQGPRSGVRSLLPTVGWAEGETGVQEARLPLPPSHCGRVDEPDRFW